MSITGNRYTTQKHYRRRPAFCHVAMTLPRRSDLGSGHPRIYTTWRSVCRQTPRELTSNSSNGGLQCLPSASRGHRVGILTGVVVAALMPPASLNKCRGESRAQPLRLESWKDDPTITLWWRIYRRLMRFCSFCGSLMSLWKYMD